LGEEERPYTRAVSSQKCIRAGGKHNDLENVGVTLRHLTFFEMLGNFSFGDYFKEGAIEFAWEFLTDVLGLNKERLYATVFDDDNEAEQIWLEKIGLPKNRVIRMGEEDNFWSMGEVGPCGPCSEILYDQGEDAGCKTESCAPGCDCDRYLEIWNLVFMQYDRNSEGKLTPLPKPSIDTGMGLERLAAVMQGKLSNYDIDTFVPIIKKIEELTGKKYGKSEEDNVSFRAIADHSRSTAFLISDGILPSNEGRGYVLRRIIRRAVRHGKYLGVQRPFLHTICSTVISIMKKTYPELSQSTETIIKATQGEEERFFETLERGLGILSDEVKKLKDSKSDTLSGEVTFKLYDTFGFPVDLTADIIKKDGLKIDEAGFNKEMDEQKSRAKKSWKGSTEDMLGANIYSSILSKGIKSEFTGYSKLSDDATVLCILKNGEELKSAAKGDEVQIITDKTPFYGESGGQVGDTGTITKGSCNLLVTDTKKPLPDIITHISKVTSGVIKVNDKVTLEVDKDRRTSIARNHTSTHILHALLRKTLGEHVRQAGSLVTADSLRFDFNHFSSVTQEELSRIEALANKAIRDNTPVTTESLSYDKAVEKGALAFFGEKYSEEVRMVSVEGVSMELCGGTHLEHTGQIGMIKINSESSVASGVRRIEALTGEAAYNKISEEEQILRSSALILKSTTGELPDKINKLIQKQKELEKQLEKLKGGGGNLTDEILAKCIEVDGIKVCAAVAEDMDTKNMRQLADTLRTKIGSGIIVLGTDSGGKAQLLAAVTKDLTSKISAGEVVKELAPIVGGKGGGRADMAQAGGKDASKIKEAIEMAPKVIKKLFS
ncbi:MAG: alanine--tRNA ligase, partial [Deltaproteobacteria bacterium]|nr:alanine--tRNA ligase [Deltaproteobacteria bacterium]